MKKKVCVSVCLFASGSKEHFSQKIDFRWLDGRKSVFSVKSLSAQSLRD